jgi:transposase
MRRTCGGSAKTIKEKAMIRVGIDVAKDKHDCCILNEEGEKLASFEFANERAGFETLLSAISSFDAPENARIGLESTGHYSINIQNYPAKTSLR